ncbi:MAG: hypothetical protein HKN91_03290 [Acidimicrobiia bacterium]|nr:hypothetical protein [Acidimicrobiia bacterium]
MIDATALHKDHFGTSADLIVRAPGRINLIGDHTDYCGLPVLPMAVGQAVQVAASRGDGGQLAAVSSLDGQSIGRDSSADPGWAKYVRAIFDEVRHLAPSVSVRLAIDGDLPSTGGLSSSSALSVGCLFAIAELWSLDLDAAAIIDLALAAERKAAIAGGAMDQTVIALARPGHALRIDFDPPSHRHVPMPPGFTWVAGYSGQKAPKGDSAADAYNSFVLASRAAARMLGDHLGIDAGSPPLLSRVTSAPREAVEGLPTVTVADAADITGGEDLGLDHGRRLDLATSAAHVLSEADRVAEAEEALGAADIVEMGRLMDESHMSLKRYGSSTPNLDRLVAAARGAGATGARVTGAGFGGWAIALAPPVATSAVCDAMESACGGPTFIATPEGGAQWSLRAE